MKYINKTLWLRLLEYKSLKEVQKEIHREVTTDTSITTFEKEDGKIITLVVSTPWGQDFYVFEHCGRLVISYTWGHFLTDARSFDEEFHIGCLSGIHEYYEEYYPEYIG